MNDLTDNLVIKQRNNYMKNMKWNKAISSITVIALLLFSGACSDSKTVIHVSSVSSNDIFEILQKQENLYLKSSPTFS